MDASFDHIVVGAGSAGCVLAGRLSEDPATRVLLLEAGPPDRSLWIHLPIGYGKTMWDKRLNWCFETDPDPNMNGRRIYWPRGRTLGGSSSINGLIYIRGQHEDYDAWAAAGNAGWSHAELLPYFRRSEGNARGGDRWHGGDGPLKVSDIGAKHPLIEAFIAGAESIGVPRTEDFNGARQEGAGYYQLTTHRGWRCSTAVAYLRPARGRPNLRVETDAHVTGLVFEGRRAVGVRYRQHGQDHEVRCRGEVLLAAGALQSPQLLQLSGVGDPALLARHGIPLRHALPGVGENLQDHLQFRLIFECTQPITTNDELNSWLGQAKIGLQWLLARKGPLAVGINQGGCFMKALPGETATPDIQFHVATLSAEMAGGQVHPFSGFTFSVCQLRPSSRGHVRIRSTDPFEPPEMQPNYLSTDLDRRTAIAAVKAARAIAASAPMRGLVKREVKPGPAAADDAAILEFCRNAGATIFHPSGTCKMGRDALAVVDERLRVHGLEGLRVVDCSVMPTLVSGNTNAPVVAMAEKAVDMIREDAARGRLAQPQGATAPALQTVEA
ncbi:choline dehydrogenase [Piscinibacter sakaiensis]|uniref:Choline dehydrogenase n=1 Tax=Piscinibacter sakaiensis TaxID=1547922 RepID=A0A0K8NZJ8_PISS1|nr:choline dehydrogenase [Piscinibacter sakaiensis]GAP35803.1 choline dehydrogenase [Piscinibacter sakaiensis]